MKSVAVIILNWNGKELLSQFLPSVVKHTPQDIANIYVADNGSNDDSVAFIRQNFPEVKLMEFDQNYGFSGGYNRAIAAIQEPYTVPVSYTHL
ncbi:MAG: glycosyltransferase, partial [Bacteroidales bacterium]|nr:glycosyltransferase [Bacteroidales bacterium]